ncbi:hypothetical protein FQZ97_577030 [compost metagenome]
MQCLVKLEPQRIRGRQLERHPVTAVSSENRRRRHIQPAGDGSSAPVLFAEIHHPILQGILSGIRLRGSEVRIQELSLPIALSLDRQPIPLRHLAGLGHAGRRFHAQLVLLRHSLSPARRASPVSAQQQVFILVLPTHGRRAINAIRRQGEPEGPVEDGFESSALGGLANGFLVRQVAGVGVPNAEAVIDRLPRDVRMTPGEGLMPLAQPNEAVVRLDLDHVGAVAKLGRQVLQAPVQHRSRRDDESRGTRLPGRLLQLPVDTELQAGRLGAHAFGGIVPAGTAVDGLEHILRP